MWKNVVANSNLVQSRTDNAVLIKLPKSEMMFWHPAKCVRQSGKNGYRLSIGYTDSFKFKIFKNGKGKTTSFTKIAEKEITAAEFEKYFEVA